MQLPAIRVYADFHCVTRWSRLDNVWSGVSTREVARLAGVKAQAKFVLALAYDYGWTTNVPLEYFLKEDSLFFGRTTASQFRLSMVVQFV